MLENQRCRNFLQFFFRIILFDKKSRISLQPVSEMRRWIESSLRALIKSVKVEVLIKTSSKPN